MNTGELWCELVNIINTFGPDSQEANDCINTNRDDTEFVEVGRLACTLQRAFIQKGTAGPPLIVEYTGILQKHGGPNSNEARAFHALHADNATFVDRAEVLHKLWPLKKRT